MIPLLIRWLVTSIMVATTISDHYREHMRQAHPLLVGIVRWRLETGVGTNLDAWRLE